MFRVSMPKVKNYDPIHLSIAKSAIGRFDITLRSPIKSGGHNWDDVGQYY
jgi:hypothetical protein